MDKKRILHIVVLTAFVVFVCLGLASACSFFTPSVSTSSIDSTEYGSKGQVDQITLVEKDFIVVGMIFITSSETRVNGEIIKGSPVTFEMLLKEAEKLGADDIVNLRIDTTSRQIYSGESEEVTTYKATALAIKYTTNR